MNTNNLHIIFDKYIQKFDEFNSKGHEEYYKWQIAFKFKPMMDVALSASGDVFSQELSEVRKLTENLIDNYTTPFYGLCKIAELEPETVRQLFLGLLADDDGDLSARQNRINAFIKDSNKLAEKYYPGSYLYKNDFHSVTTYMFLYDPDNHYLFKSSHCNNFADCIGFAEGWGGKRDFDLTVFYKMCNQVIKEMQNYPSLIEINKARFDGRFGNDLHADSQLHILLFDLIYCCTTYDLFDGITYKKTNRSSTNKELKQKQLRARQAKTDAVICQNKLSAINVIKDKLFDSIADGSTLTYKDTEHIKVISKDKERGIICVQDQNDGMKVLNLVTCVANGLIDVNDYINELVKVNYDILTQEKIIKNKLVKANQDLELYGDY